MPSPARSESFRELLLQTFGGDVVLLVDAKRDLAPGFRRLQVDDVHVTEHAFAVGVLVAVAFLERTRRCTVPMNQAHEPIIAPILRL